MATASKENNRKVAIVSLDRCVRITCKKGYTEENVLDWNIDTTLICEFNGKRK